MMLSQLKQEIARIERLGFPPDTTEVRLWDTSDDGGEFFAVLDVVEDDSFDTPVMELHFNVAQALDVEKI